MHNPTFGWMSAYVQVTAQDNDINDVMTYEILRATIIHHDNTSLISEDFVINTRTGDIITRNRISNKKG